MDTSETAPGARRAVFWLSLLGILAVQLAWIVSVPPFRGVDEHDHVFRADSVAAGHWLPSGERTSRSRGELVSVRSSLTADAESVCRSLRYTDTYDCVPFETDGPDRGLVGSGAARYHPALYAVVGSVARPFEGVTALYVMRATVALICATLLALALRVLAGWVRSPWPRLAMLVVLTPTMTYSTSIVAGNGVEMAAAALAWVSLLAAASRVREGRPIPASLMVTATLGLAIVATLRALGPLWVVLIVGSVALLADRRAWWVRLRERARATAVATVVLALALVGGAAWTVLAGTNDPRPDGADLTGSPWPDILVQVVLWFFQSIGAFPTRNEPAPVLVYALAGLVALALLVVGVALARRRVRVVMGLVAAACVLVPVALTLLTFTSVGFAWQGRYAWPLAMGVPLLAGVALAEAARRPRPTLRVVGVLAAMLGIATAAGQVGVLHQERRNPAVAEWAAAAPPAALVAAVTALGFVLLAVACLRRVDEPTLRR